MLDRLLEREMRSRRNFRKHELRRRKRILDSGVKLSLKRGVWKERDSRW
jgi:hypothetical protein